MKKRYSVLIVMCCTYLVMYLDRMVISCTLPYMADEFHLTAASMGIVMSVFFLAFAITQIPAGLLADKYGSRLMMTIAIVWWSIFTFFTGAASTLASLLGIRILFGAGEGLFSPAALKSVSTWFPKKEKGTAMSLLLSCNMLGSAVGPLLVGFIITSYGWRSIYYSLFVPGIIVALLIWYFVTNSPAERKGITKEELVELEVPTTATAASSEKISLGTVLKDPTIWLIICTSVPLHISNWAMQSWLPIYLVKGRGFSPMEMAIATAIPMGCAMVGMISFGWLSDRLFKDNRRVPLIISLLCAAFFLIFIAGAPTAKMCVMLLCGSFFFGGGSASAFWSVPLATISTKTMGKSVGVINTGSQFASFLAPMFVGFMVQATGTFNLAFAILVIFYVLAAFFAFFLKPRKDSKITESVSLH